MQKNMIRDISVVGSTEMISYRRLELYTKNLLLIVLLQLPSNVYIFLSHCFRSRMMNIADESTWIIIQFLKLNKE